MVPELTPSAAFELESQKRILRKAAPDHPAEVTEAAMKLLEQAFMLQSVLKKATHYIAELELREVLAEDELPPLELHSKRRKLPPLLMLVLRLYGYRLGPAPDDEEPPSAS